MLSNGLLSLRSELPKARSARSHAALVAVVSPPPARFIARERRPTLSLRTGS